MPSLHELLGDNFVDKNGGTFSAADAFGGKEAVGIMVTGPNGERLTFAKAGMRALMKLILGGGLASFIAGFTPKKQALHDMIAGTLVVFRGDLDRE